MATPTMIRVEKLGETMNDIRTWLDAEKIQPVEFKTVVSHECIGFAISFQSKQEARRLQKQFAALVPG